MSDFWDTLLSWGSDAADTVGDWGADAWDWGKGLFDSSGTATATTPTPDPNAKDDSWLPSWVTPQNVIGGIKAFGDVSASQAKSASEGTAEQKQAYALELEKLKQQGAIDLLKLKASLEGAGGGGGNSMAEQIAYNKKRDRYQGMLNSMQARMGARTDAGTLTLTALRNMAEAAQRPISR